MENLPVDWKSEMANQAKAAAALERPKLSNLSTRGGILAYQDTPIPGNKLPCVVVGSVFENRYYIEKFNPNKPATPDCFSLSVDGDNMVPHEKSPSAQHTQCSGCPLNEWNSAPEGGKGKACKEVRKIIVIPLDSLENGVAKAEMAILGIPVMSVKNWRDYVNKIAAENSRPPWGMITEISVVPDARSQFKVNFSALGLVADHLLGDLAAKTSEGISILMQPYTPIVEEPEAPSKGKRKF